MSGTKLVNGERVPLMPEEIAERAADSAAWETAKAEIAAKDQKNTVQATGLKTRLTNLGIEVKDLAGLFANIEDLPAAAKTRRTGKTTTAAKINELEAQVDLLFAIVALLARRL